MSWSEKNELWQRWRQGQTQSEIARALHRVSSCVYNAYIVTLVERQSRFLILIRLPNKETATVVAALARCVRRLPKG
jgi:IS30 family transposase